MCIRDSSHLVAPSLLPSGEEVLEIIAASSIRAGSEVHNTYGEHGNAELVKKYGFSLNR